LGETPTVSPRISPKRQFDRSIYEQNQLSQIKTFLVHDQQDLPDVKVSEPTPKHQIHINLVKVDQKMIDILNNQTVINKESIDTNLDRISAEISECEKNNSCSKISRSDRCSIIDLYDGNSTHTSESLAENSQFISEKVEKVETTNSNSNSNSRKLCFLLFCLGSKKQKTINHIRVKPKQELNLKNISEKRRNEVGRSGGKEEDGMCATTSSQKEPPARKQHKFCCFHF